MSDFVGTKLGVHPGVSASLHCTLYHVAPLLQAQMKSKGWDETWPLLILHLFHISLESLVVEEGNPESYEGKKFYTIL